MNTRDDRTRPEHRWLSMLGAGVLAAVIVLAIVLLVMRLFGGAGGESTPPPPRDSMPDAPGPDNRNTTLPEEASPGRTP